MFLKCLLIMGQRQEIIHKEIKIWLINNKEVEFWITRIIKLMICLNIQGEIKRKKFMEVVINNNILKHLLIINNNNNNCKWINNKILWKIKEYNPCLNNK
jgi:hypothetical protein